MVLYITIIKNSTRHTRLQICPAHPLQVPFRQPPAQVLQSTIVNFRRSSIRVSVLHAHVQVGHSARCHMAFPALALPKMRMVTNVCGWGARYTRRWQAM